MAKEEDLKRVDLKVTVNCCEGCKRKVAKAMSIKGVLKTEIHPTLPKITVIGTVDTKTLIRKLAKIGKTAEILPDETQKPKNEERSSDDKAEKAGDKQKEKEGNWPEKMADDSKSYENKVSYGVNPIGVVERSVDNNPMGINQQQVYGQMQPVMFPMPYYAAMNAYSAPMQYGFQYNGARHEPPVYCPLPPPPPPPPPMQSPASGFTDFFDEDNTVGCYVM
uniref:HMA domain-containing protein n=1 Tax=Ananas comosus var. bracteatus TaxID=296719 RepID=A0A6V7QTS6_ANACO